MGYGTQNGKTVGCWYNTAFDFSGSASDPIPRSGVQTYSADLTVRNGNNSPFIKGGITYSKVRVIIRWRAIITYVSIPVRRWHWTRLKSGKFVKHYYTVYKKKAVWGWKSRLGYRSVKTFNPGTAVLTPNQLNYSSRQVTNASGLSGSCEGRSGSDTGSGTMSGAGIMLGLYCWPGLTAFGVDVSGFINTPAAATSWANRISNGVLTKLYNNAGSNYANVANMLAQSGQTTSMVTSMLDSGISIARTIKKLDIQRAKAFAVGAMNDVHKLARDISSLWLQWTYGVKPLVDDVNKIAATVASQKAIARFRASEKTRLVQAQSYSTGGGIVSITQVCDVLVKHQVLMRTDVSIPKLAGLHGFSTPLATFWEVIPYSFILDWLYPLGDYLSNCKAFNSNVMAYHDSIMYKTKVEITSSPKHVRTSGVTTYNWNAGTQSAAIEHVQFIRSPRSYPPAMPAPRFSLGGVSQRRMLNGVALFLQRT